MNSEELGILLGGISAILASLIYFTKNIKESSCCGTNCKQVVVDGHGDVVKSGSMVRFPTHRDERDTFPKIATI
tara:strand:- start:661 stop:882 length:222 start_codon:yes stop_codon:yes gene_type:complete